MNKLKPLVGVIVGSTRPHRIGLDLTKWIIQQLNTPKLSFKLLDLKTISLPFLNEEDLPAKHHYVYEYTKQWSNIIENCDAIIAVFPQYNWGYPAPLKNAFDYLYDEWHDKPISLVTYGHHGGSQAMIAFKLVITGLKMQSLSVNPQIKINNETIYTDNNLFNVIYNLNDYKIQFKLLKEELVNYLCK